jgi:hypothetical protein
MIHLRSFIAVESKNAMIGPDSTAKCWDRLGAMLGECDKSIILSNVQNTSSQIVHTAKQERRNGVWRLEGESHLYPSFRRFCNIPATYMAISDELLE